jgi:hypothetical protein
MRALLLVTLAALPALAQPQAAAAFKTSGGNYLLTTPTGSTYNAGGVFAFNPAAARNTSGDTILAGRDQWGGPVGQSLHCDKHI